MKNWKKLAIIVGIAVVLVAVVGFTIQQSRKGVVTVQTGKVLREDLTSVVTASGEIKPKVYVNIGANAFGKITHLYVKEGDRVKKGQMLATLENVQSAADVSANEAALNSCPDRCRRSCGRGQHRRRRVAPSGSRVRARQARFRPQQGAVRGTAHRQGRLRHQESFFRYRLGPAKPGQSQAGPGQGAAGLCRRPYQPERRQPAARNGRAEQDGIRCPVRRRHHQPAGPRRGNRGGRHPEFAGQHFDDNCGHVGDHRRSEGG